MAEIRFFEFEFVMDSRATELRLNANNYFADKWNSSVQVWESIRASCNSIIISTDKDHKFVVYYERIYGVLMIADLVLKLRTSFCWKKGCNDIGSSAHMTLLCRAHALEEKMTSPYSTNATENCLPFNAKDVEEAFLQHQQNSWPKLFECMSTNENVVDEHGVRMTIQAATNFIKGVNVGLFLYPDDWRLPHKKNLQNFLSDKAFTFGSFSIRYSTSLQSFEYLNTQRSSDKWKRLCNNNECMKITCNFLFVCKEHAGGFREMVFQTILNVCDKKEWTDLSDEDLVVLEEELGRGPIKVNDNVLIVMRVDGNLMVKKKSLSMKLCTNFEESCKNIFVDSTICPKCSKINIFIARLVYVKPYNLYLLYINKEDEKRKGSLMTYITTIYKSDLRESDLEVVIEKRELGDREKAASYIGAIYIMLQIKKIYDPLCPDFNFQAIKIGITPWRLANYLLKSMYGIEITKTATLEMPAGYTLPFYIGNTRIVRHHAPFVYKTEDSTQTYIGLDNNIKGTLSLHDVAKHHYSSREDKTRFKRLKIGNSVEAIQAASSHVAIVRDALECAPPALETMSMLAHLACYEFYGTGKRLVNSAVSTSSLPLNFMYLINALMNELTPGKGIQITTTDRATWEKILKPKSLQPKDPTRTNFIHRRLSFKKQLFG